jgi:hypothetical protein
VEWYAPPPDPWGTQPHRSFLERERQEREDEELVQAELEIIAVMMQTAPELIRPFNNFTPAFLKRDELEGYLVAKEEVGPDPHSYFLPEPRFRTMKWWRGFGRWGGKEKRLTARERVAKVKPSLQLLPTGPRTSELVITRRLHEVTTGLKEALDLGRMIEGAIKYRNPKQPERKLTWRQKLRSRLIHGPVSLRWLVLNPINTMDKGKWIVENGKHQTLNLGPVDPEAARQTYPHRAYLTEIFPDAGLPKHYLQLVDRGWLTADGDLFAATPGGDFAVTVEGFPVHLPLAVMPPDYYERWRARGGHLPRKHRRRSGRRSSNRRRRKTAGCTCFLPPRKQPPFSSLMNAKLVFPNKFATGMYGFNTNGTKKTKSARSAQRSKKRKG